MPNAAIGDEQSLTFKIDHIPRPHAGYGILGSTAEQGVDLGSNSCTYPCIFPVLTYGLHIESYSCNNRDRAQSSALNTVRG